MRCPLVFLPAGLVVLLSVLPVRAEEDVPPPPRSLTAETSAAAVLAAHEADDRPALEALASRDRPDPWRVAEALCRRGAFDAAEAFARAVSRAAVEGLASYVAARREAPVDTDGAALLEALKEPMQARRWEEVLELTTSLGSDLDSVTRIQVAHLRGIALHSLGRAEDGAKLFAAVAAAAEKLGWRARAASAHRKAARSARLCSDEETAIRAYERALVHYTALNNRAGVAATLSSLAFLHSRRREYEKALPYYERALEAYEALGRQGTVAEALVNLGNTHTRLGDYPTGLSFYERALPHRESLGPQRYRQLLGYIGASHHALGNHDDALTYLERARSLMEASGDEAGVADMLDRLALVHMAQGDTARARAFSERALARWDSLNDRVGKAKTLIHLGGIHTQLGDYAQALSAHERALALREGLGDAHWAAVALGGMAIIHRRLGDYTKALDLFDRAQRLYERIGDRARQAGVLRGIGIIKLKQGKYTDAMYFQREAMDISSELGHRRGIAASLLNTAHVHTYLGEYARALSCFERAQDLLASIGDRGMVAHTLMGIGVVHLSLGDGLKALSYHERARQIYEEIEDRSGIATAHWNLGCAHKSLGSLDVALPHYERARDIQHALGDQAGVASMTGNIGATHASLGNYPEAIRCYEEALAAKRALGTRAGKAGFLADLGAAHARLGKPQEALRYLDQARREAWDLRTPLPLVLSLQELARVRLSLGEPQRAAAHCQEALRTMEGMFGALSEEEGGSARASLASIYALGVTAAHRTGNPAEALLFLDSGRAGSLLESLGGRSALDWSDLPEHLREAEAEAKAAEARARHEFGRVVQRGNLRESRRAAQALEEAMDALRAVDARIQREAKRVAGLFYPRATPLEEVQRGLAADKAMVLYALGPERALALVLTGDTARFVELGSATEVVEACRNADIANPSADAEPALRALRERLVAPIELPGSVGTVIVSPEGPLSYVPFGVLFEGKNVALTPSATTHVRLAEEERSTGRRVLALGDPAYDVEPDPGATQIYRSGVALVRLPATRDEAKAVGDVVLLGKEASEPGLYGALTRGERWRSVHIACHGLVDPERPTLSSLALTRSSDADGFLTASEILRMEIPSDLAVLSACETGRGKIVKGEGIVGLTRAFMYAGSSRVLCSLWRVPDDSTCALMTKFYELWNPEEGEGISAAAALRQAQAHIRSRSEWSHPYHWAAWVLWGLP